MSDVSLAYDAAEASFIAAVRRRAPTSELGDLARGVGDAAALWETTAYAGFFELRSALGDTDRSVIEAEIDAERAELLHGLWADLAEALLGGE